MSAPRARAGFDTRADGLRARSPMSSTTSRRTAGRTRRRACWRRFWCKRWSRPADFAPWYRRRTRFPPICGSTRSSCGCSRISRPGRAASRACAARAARRRSQSTGARDSGIRGGRGRPARGRLRRRDAQPTGRCSACSRGSLISPPSSRAADDGACPALGSRYQSAFSRHLIGCNWSHCDSRDRPSSTLKRLCPACCRGAQRSLARNSSSSSFTRPACSCCTQWPAPSTR